MTAEEYVQAIQSQSSTDHSAEWPFLSAASVKLNSNLSHASNSSIRHLTSGDSNNDVIALGLYAMFSVLGTTVNIFEISSLTIQKNLRHHGNVFLANQALANLLVSAVSFPASCIAILSGTYDYVLVCYWQWYSALQCFFTSVINFLFIAIENFIRARSKTGDSTAYQWCCGVRVVVVVAFLTWIISAGCVVFLATSSQRLDVCSRECGLNTVFLSFLAPIILTLCMLGLTIYTYRNRLNELESRQCLESREQSLHRELFKSNALAYVFFLCFWMPFAVAISTVTPYSENTELLKGTKTSLDTTNEAHLPKTNFIASSVPAVGTLLFLAQTYNCLCGLVYAFTNSSFGQAFMYLTRYFCCKAHPEFTKSSFHDTSRGTVRVHISMETRVGDRSTRSTKLMAAMSMHNSPGRRRSGGDRFL